MFDNGEIKIKFIEISETGVKTIDSKYANVRLKFLRDFNETELNFLLNENKLTEHLISVELNAETRYNELIEHEILKEATNSRKITDKMIEQIEKAASRQVEEEILFV